MATGQSVVQPTIPLALEAIPEEEETPSIPDSFAESQAKDDEAASKPKSPATIHAIHGSIYDYLKEP
ncbi:hypothetical protein WN944_027058 [Citrus x changshan-huyou]|uniref:Uncharacterized protein n=1 Tax=Citrus x changshan-huyou TaxID=2935761 RepID=A0AAP0Q8U4_9ROSI